jgi:hypothetical protein
MIENTPENRQIITKYLESIREDAFINEFITPFYSAHGYYLYCVRHKIGIFLFGIFCYTPFLFFHFHYFYEAVFYDFDYLS